MRSPRPSVRSTGGASVAVTSRRGLLERPNRRRDRRVGNGAQQARLHGAPLPSSLTMNIGWIIAWSAARIVCLPLGPSNDQPSSAGIVLATSSPSARSTACTIICAATNPSLSKISGSLPDFLSEAASAALALVRDAPPK